jgi:hypothetical protein
MWLLILSTTWFPLKILSCRYFDLDKASIPVPGIFIFGFLLFIIGVIAFYLVSTKKKDSTRYLSLVFAGLSLLLAFISLLPGQGVLNIMSQIFEQLGWVYGGILIVALGLVIVFNTINILESSMNEKLDTN